MPMKTALVLIDIQKDYFPGGRMELQGSPEAAVRARGLLDFFRLKAWPTYHIQHVSIRPGATFFLPDTEGVQIHASIAPLPGEAVIVKHFPNSFRETPLLKQLQESSVDRLVICGSMTHMCVDATVRAATDLGFPVLLAGDACATRSLVYSKIRIPADQVHAAFLAALTSYGQVLTSDEVLLQLQR